MIASIKRNEKVCHYLDLPIQHADDMILKRMGRRTSQADLRSIVTKLRSDIPDIALRTTLICGFPGETEKEHESLMYFINEMEFDRLGAFTYSPEEDTPAAAFDDQVDEKQKSVWQQEVMELQEEIIIDANERMIGRELYCMIEGQVSGENTYVGRTYRDAPDIDGYIFIDTAIFIVASLTDMADGKIARKYNLVTNFGKFMDPLADKLLVCSAMICLVEIDRLAAWIVIVIIAREFIISGFRLVASDNGIVIAASYWGKFKTTFQMLMIIALILDFQNRYFQMLATALTYIALILTVVSLIDYIAKNKQVLKEQK